MTIATSDSGAGAGVQADLLSFAANGVFGVTCFAALTAQHPEGVSEVHPLPRDFLRAQYRQLESFFEIAAIKVGMLFSAELIEETARLLHSQTCPVVIDPVMVASSGAPLLADDAQQSLVEQLLPRATVITPNLDEAGVLLNCPLATASDIRSGARRLVEQFETAVLIKGGHLEGEELFDFLLTPDGTQLELTAARREVDTHGSGCTLSAAIAARLAQGEALTEAVSQAHAYLQHAFRAPLQVQGKTYLNHFPGSAL